MKPGGKVEDKAEALLEQMLADTRRGGERDRRGVAPDFADLLSEAARRGLFEDGATQGFLENYEEPIDLASSEPRGARNEEVDAWIDEAVLATRAQVEVEARERAGQSLPPLPLRRRRSNWQAGLFAAAAIGLGWFFLSSWSPVDVIARLSGPANQAEYVEERSSAGSAHEQVRGEMDRGAARPIAPLTRSGPPEALEAPQPMAEPSASEDPATVSNEQEPVPAEGRAAGSKSGDKATKQRGRGRPAPELGPREVPEVEDPRAKLKRLDEQAQAAWARGELARAEELLRELVRVGGRDPLADLAYGDLFTIVARRADPRARAPLVRAYLRSFPKGRYAEDAWASLCEGQEDPKAQACWAEYAERFPSGVHRDKIPPTGDSP